MPITGMIQPMFDMMNTCMCMGFMPMMMSGMSSCMQGMTSMFGGMQQATPVQQTSVASQIPPRPSQAPAAGHAWVWKGWDKGYIEERI